MKRFFLFILLLISVNLFAQPGGMQKPTTRGYELRNVIIDSFFALPADTFSVPTDIRTYPHTARKGTTIYVWNTSTFAWQSVGGAGVTSVGLSMPSAFNVANSPIIGSGTLAVTGTGTTDQYIRGDGTLGSSLPSALIPTWQQTLTAGSTLTTPNTISMGSNRLLFDNPATNYYVDMNPVSGRLEYYAESGSGGTFKSSTFDGTPDDFFIQTFDAVYGNLNYLMGVGSGGTYEGDGTGVLLQVTSPDSSSRLLVRHNEIRIKPDRGSILIDTLTNRTSQDKVMGWTEAAGASRGYMGYLNLGSGLSISGGTLNTSGTVATPISSLTAGVASNTINSGNNTQTWQWNSLASETGIGLHLQANTTGADGTGQSVLKVTSEGANGAAAFTYSIWARNLHTGAGSNNFGIFSESSGGVTNIGGQFQASGGSNNYAIIVPASSGSVGIGTSTPSKVFHTVGTVRHASLGTASSDTTTYKPLGIDSNGDVFPMIYWPGGGGSGATVALDNLSGVAINTSLLPGTSGGPDLGSTTKQFGSVFLEEGGVINFDAGDATITQTGNEVALAGADLKVSTGRVYGDGANTYLDATTAGGTFLYYTSANKVGADGDGWTGTSQTTGHIHWRNGTDGPLSLFPSNDNERNLGASDRRWKSVYTATNVFMVGTAVGTSGVGVLVIGNGTPPGSSPANSIQLYAEDVAASSELKVRDEAGNITTLSPHNFSGIPQGPSEEMAWSFYSEKDGKYVNVDMLKLARLVEKLTGEKLVYTGKTDKK